jgi:hypothetical protein
MIESTRRRTNTNIRPNNTRLVKEDNKEILILKDRDGKPVRFEIKPNNNTKPRVYDRPENNRNSNNNIRRNNNTKPRAYDRPENNRNSNSNIRRNNSNTRPVIRNNSSSTRPSAPPRSSGNRSSGGSSVRR